MKQSKKKILVVLLPILLLVVLVALDQITKACAVASLKDQAPKVLIRNVLELFYLENHGAAFSMLQNKQWAFWILTIVFLCIAIWFYVKVPKQKRYIPLTAAVFVLVAGAIGNFIDRIAHKYVIDFIYFSIIDFPVFNVADIYVTISVIVLIALILFKYKGKDDLKFLSSKKKGK